MMKSIESFELNTINRKKKLNHFSDEVKKGYYYKIERQCELKDIPIIKDSCRSLTIGYGKNSIYLNEEIFEKRYDNNIDRVINEINSERIWDIPIISVTGTNGKTTTVRLIHTVLTSLGYISGLASTGGIFIGNNKVMNGDTTGFYSARKVLSSSEVEVAVLETARGGIIKRGIGYKKARVAVFTSISDDHIGMGGANSIEDIIKIKTSIFDEIHPDGKIVCCNNPLLMDSLKDRKTVCLFGIDFDFNMKSHKEMGYEGMFLEDNHIIYFKNNTFIPIVDIRDLPFTHKGFSRSNIKNIMATIMAVIKVHPNLNDIIEVLKTIKCDLSINSGRQNIIDMGKFNLVLDYGHNSESFTEVFNIVKSFNPKAITAIIGAAGDRQDKYISELGYIATKYSDNIIIREQEDLRDRNIGESARLLMKGVMDNKDFDITKVKVIYKEEEALANAMKDANEGEFIVLFTQCLHSVIPVVNEFLKSLGKEKLYRE